MMPSLFHQRLAACGACPRLLYVPQYMGRCDTLTTTARKPWLFRQPTERRLEGLQIVGTSRRALAQVLTLVHANTATVGRAVFIGAGSARRAHFSLLGPMRGGFCRAVRMR